MALPTASRGKDSETTNSFQTRLSEAVSDSAAKRTATLKFRPNSMLQQIPDSQKIGAPRQSIVARTQTTSLATSRIDTGSATAAVNSPTVPAAITDTPATPADIIASLLRQNPAPTPYAPTWNPTTNPAVFMTDDYDKQGNLSLIMREVNHENGLRFGEYQNGLQNWLMGGMRGSPPAPPHYETVDMKGFEKWWADYDATFSAPGGGEAAPISTFVSNTVPDAGYL